MGDWLRLPVLASSQLCSLSRAGQHGAVRKAERGSCKRNFPLCWVLHQLWVVAPAGGQPLPAVTTCGACAKDPLPTAVMIYASFQLFPAGSALWGESCCQAPQDQVLASPTPGSPRRDTATASLAGEEARGQAAGVHGQRAG